VRQVHAEPNWDNELRMGFGAEDVAVVDHQDTGPAVRAERIDTTSGGWRQVKDTTVAWGQETPRLRMSPDGPTAFAGPCEVTGETSGTPHALSTDPCGSIHT
jgi:hypothetical protein